MLFLTGEKPLRKYSLRLLTCCAEYENLLPWYNNKKRLVSA
jgi:hypothetical protein